MVQSYVILQGNPRADATGSFGVGTYFRYYSDHIIPVDTLVICVTKSLISF